MFTTRFTVALMTFAAFLTFCSLATAQTTVGSPFHVITASGFLGQPDGFYELPRTGPQTEGRLPYGGMLGVRRWIESSRQSNSVVLINGNNLPSDFVPDCNALNSKVDPFWRELTRVRPDMIGLGAEDFIRALNPARNQTRPDKAKDLVEWFESGACQLPFLASNAFVQTNREGLNSVVSGVLQVNVSEDESLPLLDALSVTISASIDPQARPCFVLEGKTDADQRTHLVMWRDGVAAELDPTLTLDCSSLPVVFPRSSARIEWSEEGESLDARLQLPSPLRPGLTYTLQASWKPAIEDSQSTTEIVGPLKTVRALTPGLGTLPVRVARSGQTRVVGIGMVPPETQEILPVSAWQYEDDTTSNPETHRIVLLPALETVETLRRIVEAQVPGCGPSTSSAEPCLFTLLSSLADADNLAVLSGVPEMRIVALHPETSMLGRSTRNTEAGPGELGFYSILNGNNPDIVQALIRPEWIGETVAIVAGTATPTSPTKLDLTVSIERVAGPRLLWRPCGEDQVCYWAQFGEEPPTQISDPFEPYAPHDPANPVWTDQVTFGAYANEIISRNSGAQISIFPLSYLDSDVFNLHTWLAENSSPNIGALLNDGLSRFVLERVVYRQERVVKTTLDGATLAGLLATLSRERTSSGERYCVTGIRPSGCLLETDGDMSRLLIGNRRINEEDFYAVALPEALAEAHEFPFDDNHYTDIVEALDGGIPKAPRDVRPGFIQGDAAALAPVTVASLGPPQIPAPAAAPAAQTAGQSPYTFSTSADGPFFFFRLHPPNIEYSEEAIHSPEGSSAEQFAAIPIAGSSIESAQNIAAEGMIELGIDTQYFDIMGRSYFNIAKKRLPERVSFSPDQWESGVFPRIKLPGWPIAFFSGVFLDTRFVRGDEAFTSQIALHVPDPDNPDGEIPGVTKDGPPARVINRKATYLSWGSGIETLYQEGPSYLRLMTANARFDFGRNYASREGVRVNGIGKDFDAYVENGAEAFVTDVLEEETTLRDAELIVVDFDYLRRRQNRFVGKAEFQSALTERHKLNFTTEYRKWFSYEGQTSLAPEWSLYFKAEAELPMKWRLAVIPYYERTIVRARGVDGYFALPKMGFKFQLPLDFKKAIPWSVFQ